MPWWGGTGLSFGAGVAVENIFDFVPAFWGTPTAVLRDHLLPYATFRPFERGETFGEINTHPSHVLVICSGSWVITDRRNSTLAAVRSAGDLTLDGSVLRGEKEPFGRRALTESVVLQIEAERFKRFAAASREFDNLFKLEHVTFAADNPQYDPIMKAPNAKDRVIGILHKLVRSINFPILDDGIDPYNWTWFYRPDVAAWAGTKNHKEVTLAIKEVEESGAFLPGLKQGQPVVNFKVGTKKTDILKRIASCVPDYNLPDGPTNGILDFRSPE